MRVFHKSGSTGPDPEWIRRMDTRVLHYTWEDSCTHPLARARLWVRLVLPPTFVGLLACGSLVDLLGETGFQDTTLLPPPQSLGTCLWACDPPLKPSLISLEKRTVQHRPIKPESERRGSS
jgi:hypothetical protein